jgi:transcriptional regulator with XRE-family HTH domain
VAAALNVTPHQLQKYETGENRISASRLVDCARSLSVPVAWFYQNITFAKFEIDTAKKNQTLMHDESELLQNYRTLSTEAQHQLSSIAKLLQGENSKTRKTSKRT